jgi:hypothetical protein
VRAGEALNADEEHAVQAVLGHVLRCGGPDYLQALAEVATDRQAAGHQALRRLV